MTSKKPEIRFKRFTEAWEQRKLQDISNKVTEKNVNNIYDETFTNSAEFGIVSQKDFFDKEISNKKNINSYYVVHNNDFVYNPRISNYAPVGPIKRNNLGRTGVMSPLYYVFRTNSISLNFLEIYFQTTYWHNFMKLNGDSGARSDRFAIRNAVLGEMLIPYPTINEQEKIGDFFKHIDDTIALHQHELTLLKQRKKAFLQKMFPKKDKSIPEIRFKGFVDRWEKNNLSKIANFNPKSSIPSKFEYVDLGSVIGTSLINHRTEYIDSAPSRAQRLAKKGDIFYQTVRPYQKNNFLFNKQDDNFVFSTGYAQLRPKINSYFLLNILQNQLFVSTVLNYCTGTSYPAINSSELASIEVNIPIDMKEQATIGNFFKQLDDSINLQEGKIEYLKQMKKAFLKKMFV